MARRRARRTHYGSYPEASRPLEALGGIRAQSKRGPFGESWWAKRWIKVTESSDIGARLSRGKTYARKGQVLSIDISAGRVEAFVQGSDEDPYKVVITVEPYARAQREALAKRLSSHALFAARMMAGELPKEIEKVFREADLSLFPEAGIDLDCECSCSDFSSSCKHIAAIFYLLGEEFDRDPFLLFKLRGMERDELLTSEKERDLLETSSEEEPRATPEPIPLDTEAFWGRDHSGETPPDKARPPTVSAALPKRLGNFSFWRGEERFLETMERVYDLASPAGMDILLADSVDS